MSDMEMILLQKRFAPPSISITKEELCAAWGNDLFSEIEEDARELRAEVWEAEKALNDNIQPIDLEPSPELILAVACRKLFKISLYNRGDFPNLDLRLNKNRP